MLERATDEPVERGVQQFELPDRARKVERDANRPGRRLRPHMVDARPPRPGERPAPIGPELRHERRLGHAHELSEPADPEPLQPPDRARRHRQHIDRLRRQKRGQVGRRHADGRARPGGLRGPRRDPGRELPRRAADPRARREPRRQRFEPCPEPRDLPPGRTVQAFEPIDPHEHPAPLGRPLDDRTPTAEDFQDPVARRVVKIRIRLAEDERRTERDRLRDDHPRFDPEGGCERAPHLDAAAVPQCRQRERPVRQRRRPDPFQLQLEPRPPEAERHPAPVTCVHATLPNPKKTE